MIRGAAAALLWFAPCPGVAQISPAGIWAGTIAGHDPPLAVHIVLADTGGVWTGAIDLPSAGVLGVPLRAVRVDGPAIGLELPTDRGPIAFEGALGGGELRGRVRLGDREDGFTLRRARPEPLPYRTESVEFSNGDVMLSGTLLVPDSGGPHPAVVFLHGSGPERRDNARYWADRLARCGVAALIYDKRGTGGSTDGQGGGWARARFSDLAGDGAAAIRHLRGRREVDAGRVGLVGQSQGAWLAPLVAGRAGRVAFLVLMSGGGATPAEHELHDDAARLRDAGHSDSVIDRATALQERINAYLRTGESRGALAEELERARREAWFDLTELPAEPPPLSAVDASWWRRHMDFDPVPLVARLGVPVLAVFGERDRLVPVDASAARLTAALAAAPESAVRILPGADHTLHVWTDADGRGPWPHLADGLPELLTSWISDRAGGTCRAAG